MCWTSDSLLFKAGTVLFGGEKPIPTRSKYQTEAHRRNIHIRGTKYFAFLQQIKKNLQNINKTNTNTEYKSEKCKNAPTRSKHQTEAHLRR